MFECKLDPHIFRALVTKLVNKRARLATKSNYKILQKWPFITPPNTGHISPIKWDSSSIFKPHLHFQSDPWNCLLFLYFPAKGCIPNLEYKCCLTLDIVLYFMSSFLPYLSLETLWHNERVTH